MVPVEINRKFNAVSCAYFVLFVPMFHDECSSALEMGIFACTLISSLTAQSTTRPVSAIDFPVLLRASVAAHTDDALGSASAHQGRDFRRHNGHHSTCRCTCLNRLLFDLHPLHLCEKEMHPCR